MGCCGEDKRVHSSSVNGRWVPPDLESFEGPTKDRQCTDIIFLILFVVFCIFLIIVLGVAVGIGDPYRLLYGYDNYGNVCGRNNTKIKDVSDSGKDMTDKPYLTTDFEVECRSNADCTVLWKCIDKCSDDYRQLGYRCYKEKVTVGVFKKAEKFGQTFFEQLGADVKSCTNELIALCFISVGLAIVLIIVLRFCAAIIIWAVLIIVGIASIILTSFLWYNWHQRKKEADELSDDDSQKEGKMQTQKSWLAAAIISTIFMVIYLLLVFIMRKRIGLVAALYKEAGKAIGSMPLLLIQPVWTFIALGIVCTILVVGFFFLQTSGQPEVNESGYVNYRLNTFFQAMRWYHLFAIFWLTQFIISCQHVVIAGAVATWFFTRDKSKLGSPILTSTKNVVRYHLGSIALGSLIIAIIKLIRFIMKQVERQLKKQDNPARYVLMCCQCCLACFEKFLQFLNKNAYIEIAIYGYNFCTAAKEALRVLTSNALRVGAINSVGDFVLFVGKTGITIAVGFIAMEIIKNKEGLYYEWSPIVIACIFAFLVAHAFLAVYEMAIDTLFVCFCEDCERNDGISKPYFMSKGLMKFVENSKKVLGLMNEEKSKGG
ncbi:choline transporter-like protein 1 [Centruroides vittatus]|uniref:choline transporter-like protein 1 n=1 Tax=Centruroides vittatus TaxID=120091 RepID=UPI00350FD632